MNGNVAIPSVFIIDKNHIIKYIHTDSDYKVRLDGETIYGQAKQLIGQ